MKSFWWSYGKLDSVKLRRSCSAEQIHARDLGVPHWALPPVHYPLQHWWMRRPTCRQMWVELSNRRSRWWGKGLPCAQPTTTISCTNDKTRKPETGRFVVSSDLVHSRFRRLSRYITHTSYCVWMAYFVEISPSKILCYFSEVMIH